MRQFAGYSFWYDYIKIAISMLQCSSDRSERDAAELQSITFIKERRDYDEVQKMEENDCYAHRSDHVPPERGRVCG